MELHVLLAVVGLAGGLLAGWVGLGGGIILAPLLLYVPPLFGLSPLGMKQVARLTIIQSLCGTAAAAIAHRRPGLMDRRLVGWMGATIAAAGLAGAALSEWHLVSERLLLGLFAAMAFLAAALMLRHPPEEEFEDHPAPGDVPFDRSRAVMIALGVGFFGGMVGQSGAFLTIPLLIHVLRLPVRLAISSSLGITFCAALAGSFGKLAAGGPVQWTHVAALVAGSLVGSQLGAWLNRHVPVISLRLALAALIGASAVGMCIEVLRP